MNVMKGHTTEAPTEAPGKGRYPWHDEKGRWLPGNPGGPGNPHVREMARLKRIFREETPDCNFKLLLQGFYDLALQRYWPALKLYLEYMLGKPDRGVDADLAELHEIELSLKRTALFRRIHKEAGLPANGFPHAPEPFTPPP